MIPEIANYQGIGYNTSSVKDMANFLTFLKELRQNPVGVNLTLSAAIGLTPFFNATGNPLTDVTGFVKVLDYITVMNYDVWGPWFSTVGPNTPLKDTCTSSANQEGSAVSAVKGSTDAGRLTHQIALGIASYGHLFSIPPSGVFVSGTKTLAAFPTFNALNKPLGNI
ncbi:glycoside hydrolase superfamily [Suillus ampliporus]|nr:glycoside hydrolase superfamily [Suillus ampliporus]